MSRSHSVWYLANISRTSLARNLHSRVHVHVSSELIFNNHLGKQKESFTQKSMGLSLEKQKLILWKTL